MKASLSSRWSRPAGVHQITPCSAALLATIACLAGCATPPQVPALDCLPTRPVAGQSSRDSLQVDVFLDATTSMVGYTAFPNGEYLRFLQAIEATVVNGWKYSQVHFFKFGRRVRQIDRNAFLSARTPAFYAEPGLFETTNIDSVIERTSRSRVSIVVTDLFQHEGDVNAIVARIKQRCFLQGIDVGVLAVPSQFDGQVYDAQIPPYRYRSTPGQEATYRPFYALFFGDAANLGRLVSFLAANGMAREEHFVLLGGHVVDACRVQLSKTRETTDLNLRVRNLERNETHFDLKKGGTGGALIADVLLRRNPRTPDFRSDQVDLVAYSTSSDPLDQGDGASLSASNALSLRRIDRHGDTLRAVIDLNVSGSSGTYAYEVRLQTGTANSFVTPAWVDSFSTDRPTPTEDANKTLNLKKFVSDLIQANASVRQAPLATLHLSVQKK